jgi:hypothetical protein
MTDLRKTPSKGYIWFSNKQSLLFLEGFVVCVCVCVCVCVMVYLWVQIDDHDVCVLLYVHV